MKKLITTLLLLYIHIFAKLALVNNRATFIGITGSAGKTSARDMLFAILKDKYHTYAITKGNSETGVALGILGLKVESIGFSSLHKSIKDWLRILILAPTRLRYLQQYDYVLVEMGIDDPFLPKNMSYLLDIVKPDIAVVLNAYGVHGENFEKVVSPPVTAEKIVTAIAQEKCKIVTENPRCRFAVFNSDNKPVRNILEKVAMDKGTFGKDSINKVSYASYNVSTHATHFSYLVRDGETHQKLAISIKQYVLPEVYQETCAAALVVALYLGIKPADSKAALEKNFSMEPSRSSVLKGIEDSLIIDSSYNASPEAMHTLIRLAFELKKQTHRPLVFVLGDMRELGTAAKQRHEELADTIADMADYLYTVGPLMEKHIYQRLIGNKKYKDLKAFSSPHDARKYLKKHPVKNAIMLFKGSQNTIFLEEAIKYVLADSHDATYLARQEDYWLRRKQFTLTKDLGIV